jgi:hypothetical protein
MVAKVATGSKDKSVLAFGFERLSTYGILPSWTTGEIEAVLDALVKADALEHRHTTRVVNGLERTYKELDLTSLGHDVMFARAPEFQMVFPRTAQLDRRRPAIEHTRAVAPDLLAALKDVRSRLAKADDRSCVRRRAEPHARSHGARPPLRASKRCSPSTAWGRNASAATARRSWTPCAPGRIEPKTERLLHEGGGVRTDWLRRSLEAVAEDHVGGAVVARCIRGTDQHFVGLVAGLVADEGHVRCRPGR